MRLMLWRGARASILLMATSYGALVAAQSTSAPLSRAADPAGAAPAAPAAQPADIQEGDIVVTATKRETRLQQTPIAISAVSGEQLVKTGLRNLQDLAITLPSVVIGNDAGLGINTAIRGIDSFSASIAADNPVGFYIDGVYVARATSSMFGLSNVERVEVLRGPQGTLFGRNTTAGAISVITKLPSATATEGMADVDYGNYGHLRFRGSFSGPLSDTVSLLVAGYHDQMRSFADRNVRLNRDEESVRGTNLQGVLRFQPGSGTDIVLRADYGTDHPISWAPNVVTKPGYVGTAAQASVRNIANTIPSIDAISTDTRNFTSRRQHGVSLTVDQPVADVAKITSITAYRESHGSFLVDTDGTPVRIAQTYLKSEIAKQFSQELRLASTGTGAINWLAGLYYFRERGDALLLTSRYAIPDELGFDPRSTTNSYAAFADVGWTIAKGLTLRPGIRYTHERKAFSNGSSRLLAPSIQNDAPQDLVFDQSKRSFTRSTYSDVSPKFGIDYRFNSDVMVYGLAQKGFKSGANNLTATDFVTNPTVKPEKVWSYEGGLKSDLFDRVLRFNLTGFVMNYQDLQVRAPSTTPGIAIIRNASNAKVKGLEIESTLRPLRGLALTANATILNGKYKDYNIAATPADCVGGRFDAATGICSLSGNRLQRAPRFKSSANALYRFSAGSVDVELSGTWSHTSTTFYDDRNLLGTLPVDLFDAYALISPTKSAWSFRIWGRNLSDKRYYTHLNPIGAAIIGYGNLPRTFGGTVSIKF